MVAQDQVTAWDLKPNRENTNQIFNVLCNVQPVEHPWSGDGPTKNIDVVHGSKQQFRFEKCKGLKRCKLYKYAKKNNQITLEELGVSRLTKEKGWSNANFTDVITFQGYRIYMRRSNEIVEPYGQTRVDGDYTLNDNGERTWRVNTDLEGYLADDGEIWHQQADVPFMRGGGDGNEDTCDDGEYQTRNHDTLKTPPSRDIRERTIESTASNEDEQGIIETHEASARMRIYIQQIDEVNCTGDTFDDADTSPIILVKEYESAECNPDHFIMGYGGIGTPKGIKGKDGGEAKIAIIYFGGQYFAYLYNVENRIAISDWVSIPNLGIYVTGLTVPETDTEQMNIIMESELPPDGYFIPNVSELIQVIKFPEKVEGEDMVIESSDIGNVLWAYPEYGEVPYFAAGNKIYSINGFYSRKDNKITIPSDDELPDIIYRGEDFGGTPCQSINISKNFEVSDPYPILDKRIFLFDTLISTATNKDIITGIERWGTRICYIADNLLYVSGSGSLNGLFTPTTGDTARGVFRIPAGLTDVRSMYGSLLLFGPKNIYAIANQDALVAGNFINASENEDGYYSPGSFYNDDGEFLIVRRGKLLETLQFSAYYGTIQFTPDTGFFVNGHIKPLDNRFDKINIDATINHRYISIFDNNDVSPDPDDTSSSYTDSTHYSKLLIYDKHYNCWYYWMIDGARVVHVKDGIFLGDYVYVNKGNTWGRDTFVEKDGEEYKESKIQGGEIVEVISAYVGEEGLQTPKHIQYVKTAIGDHSDITNDSTREINTTLGGKLFERMNDITTTRYPQLLSLKESTKPIMVYENGEKIYGHGKMYSHTLFNEVAGYRDLKTSKPTTKTIREMGEDSDYESKLAMFASIKEPVNAPANVLELCITARGIDNVQFGSFYIGYYVLDPDYEDIENTHIDQVGLLEPVGISRTKPSYLTDATFENKVVINKGEYCDEVLSGSTCDSSEMNDKL